MIYSIELLDCGTMTALTSLLNHNVSRASQSSIILHTAPVSAIVILHVKCHIQHVCRLSTGSGSSYSRARQQCPGVHEAITGAASRYSTGESDRASELYPNEAY